MKCLFHFNEQNIFCHCCKKHMKWGDEVMKRISPIIRFSMTSLMAQMALEFRMFFVKI